MHHWQLELLHLLVSLYSLLLGHGLSAPFEAKVRLKQLAVTEAPLSDTMLQVKQQCVYY